MKYGQIFVLLSLLLIGTACERRASNADEKISSLLSYGVPPGRVHQGYKVSGGSEPTFACLIKLDQELDGDMLSKKLTLSKLKESPNSEVTLNYVLEHFPEIAESTMSKQRLVYEGMLGESGFFGMMVVLDNRAILVLMRF